MTAKADIAAGNGVIPVVDTMIVPKYHQVRIRSASGAPFDSGCTVRSMPGGGLFKPCSLLLENAGPLLAGLS